MQLILLIITIKVETMHQIIRIFQKIVIMRLTKNLTQIQIMPVLTTKAHQLKVISHENTNQSLIMDIAENKK